MKIERGEKKKGFRSRLRRWCVATPLIDQIQMCCHQWPKIKSRLHVQLTHITVHLRMHPQRRERIWTRNGCAALWGIPCWIYHCLATSHCSGTATVQTHAEIVHGMGDLRTDCWTWCTRRRSDGGHSKDTAIHHRLAHSRHHKGLASLRRLIGPGNCDRANTWSDGQHKGLASFRKLVYHGWDNGYNTVSSW